MASIISNRSVGSVLVKRGLVPNNCYNAEILIAVNGAMSIRYEVYVTGDDLLKLSDAFAEIAVGKTSPTGEEAL